MQIEHDYVLILEMTEPFLDQVVAGDPNPVDLRRIDQGRAEGENFPARKIGAVQLPFPQAAHRLHSGGVLQISDHIAHAGVVKPGTINLSHLGLVDQFLQLPVKELFDRQVL